MMLPEADKHKKVIIDRVIAREVMQSPRSVRPSVCFRSNFRTKWPLTLTFSIYVGHDLSSHGIEGHRLDLWLPLGLQSQIETRSLGPWSSINDSFPPVYMEERSTAMNVLLFSVYVYLFSISGITCPNITKFYVHVACGAVTYGVGMCSIFPVLWMTT